ncbi:hypothetical protein IFR04_002274 [Cadophora malorum]|uniref:Uncharacterized protein n=1 Tax=Cadophora malorum TaxID=108018 RepID=A0A8H7WGW1_9HELO|nr:hypothetical protein IFR04_002274 [Cadophora malorum]
MKRLQFQFQGSRSTDDTQMDLHVAASKPNDFTTLAARGNSQDGPVPIISHGPVVESALPRELRDQIYEHTLALRPGIRPPALLEVTTMEKRQEILEMYRQVNYVAHKNNYDAFRRIPLGILRRVRHLTIKYEYEDWEEGTFKEFFRSDKTQLINHFTTLTIDLPAFRQRVDFYPMLWGTIIRCLISASKEGIENTTIVFARPGSDLERWALEKMNNMLGLSPKLIPDDISGRRLHVLVWEGNKHYIQFRAQRSRSDPEQMARF